MASRIGGNSDSGCIAGTFSDKYPALYNSVPYDNTEMKRIKAEVMTRLHKCNDDSYNITVHDVMNAVIHLKTGKSDGSEGYYLVIILFMVIENYMYYCQFY